MKKKIALTPSFVTSQGNQIWLSTLALAWQQFYEQTKFTLQFPENSEFQKNIAESLQNLKCTPNDVDSSVIYKAVGQNFTPNKLNKLLEQTFPNQQVQKVDFAKHDQIIFYGAMHKKLRLQYPFYNIKNKIMHFCKIKVPCYEPMTLKQRKQVFVISYAGEEDFMVRIDTAQEGVQMFMLMSRTKINLDQVFELVKKSNDQIEHMSSRDVFKFPKIKINFSHIVTEFSCVKLKIPNENKKYEIFKLIESVSFQILGGSQDEDDGRDLTLTVPQEEGPTMKKRRMCLNNPFWLVLRQKGHLPYFAMFVNKPTQPSQPTSSK